MFRSPFRWIWVVGGVLIFSLLGIGLAFTAYWLFLGHSLFWWAFLPFSGLGLLIIFLLFAVFVIRIAFMPWRRFRRYDPAMQTLRERYARGDITKDQFVQMARDLREHA